MVLLDEVEKAHPDVLNVLLGVLDDGRLTDAKGRTVSFANTIVILTSNLGSDALLEAGTNPDAQAMARKLALQAVHNHFRPEFLNRLDEVRKPLDLSRGPIRCTVHVSESVSSHPQIDPCSTVPLQSASSGKYELCHTLPTVRPLKFMRADRGVRQPQYPAAAGDCAAHG